MNPTNPTSVTSSPFPEIDDLPVVPDMPDPLVFRDGAPVTSLEEWEIRRKPELRGLFQHYMYGFAPEASPIRATVRSTDDSLFGGAATLQQVSIAFGPEGAPPIELLLALPNVSNGARPSGVFLGLNFGGNHTVLAEPSIRLPEGANEADRGKAAGDWSIQEVITRGYAVATFHSADIAPDRPDFTGGVFPFFDPPGADRSEHAWGIIAAWAWGLQRAVDYLLTDARIDADRVLLYGFSRNGKAALLSAAFDARVSGVIAHQAGCGGSGPSRCESPDAETVSLITKAFPCWFASEFARFGGREERLPFDQNCLVALCAPRPVLFPAGSRDRWADPDGQRKVLRSAASVYALYGVDTQSADLETAPEFEKLIGDRLVYCLRDTTHGVGPAYWALFADFADAQLPARA